MKDKLFKELYRKFLDGRMNPDEVDAFRLMVRDEQYTEELQQLLQVTAFDERDATELDYDKGTVFRELLTRIQAEAPAPVQAPAAASDTAAPVIPLRPAIRLSRSRIRWIAAAVILLLVTGGGIRFYLDDHPSLRARPLADIPLTPGGNKAILTLADGTRIALDSSAGGTLALQGNARIVKLDSGEIAYEATGGNSNTPGNNTTGSNTPGSNTPGSSAATGSILPGLYNKIETPRGGQFKVVLPDGSKVWLNAASSIRYPSVFAAASRTVEVSGEAYFEVAHDPAKPFLVHTRGMEVQVLGTAFDLMAYPDEDTVRTTLVSGSVKVVNGSESRLIRPGEQASLGGDGFVVSKPNLYEVLGWKEGEFRFRGASITVIMRQLARWYDVQVAYEGAMTDNHTYYGVIPRKQEAQDILDVLALTKNVHFRIEGRKITVLPGSGRQ